MLTRNWAMATCASIGSASNVPGAAPMPTGPPVAAKTVLSANRSSSGVRGKAALYSVLYFVYTKCACASTVADVPQTVVPCSMGLSKVPAHSVHWFQAIFTINPVLLDR